MEFLIWKLFVEDKWAEWDESQSSYIPSNIAKGQETTHVADNIDWKKSISGNETHHTNSILIQHQPDGSSLPNVTCVKGDYKYDRSNIGHSREKNMKFQISL